MSERPPRSALSERLARRRERHLQRSRAYRAVFAFAGFVVTGTGIALLVLPGPALAVIPIGLAMLALEFAWAERILEQVLDRAEAARESAAGASRGQRALGMVALGLAVAALVAAALLWDIPLLPF